MKFDEATSRRLEAMYQSPDVIGRRRAVMQALAPRKGERIIDVGSGPGLMAEELADVVGKDGKVCGIDSSESMIGLSRGRSTERPWLEFRVADAMALPYADQSFDGAVCVQVLEYVPDVAAALRELNRVLRPSGRAVIVDTDWESIVWHSSDARRMRRVLGAWDEHLHDAHLPPKLSGALRSAGFTLRERSVVSMFNPEFDQLSISGGLMDLILAFVPGRQGVSEEEVKLWASDLHVLGKRGDYFFSLTQFLFLAFKAE